MTQHLLYPQIEAWFCGTKPAPLDAVYYRMAGPAYTCASQIISGEGAFHGGGRWNQPGVMKVVYLSDDPVTAAAESTEHHRHYGLPIWQAMPKVTVAVAVRTSRAINLTDAANAASFPVTMADLLREDWHAAMNNGQQALAQAVGLAAFNARIHLLIVESKARPGARNAVVFPQLFTAPNILEIKDALLLEKLGKPA